MTSGGPTLTVKEAGAVLRVGERAVQAQVRQGKLKSETIAGRGGKAGALYVIPLEGLPRHLQERALALWPELGAGEGPSPARPLVKPRRIRNDRWKRRNVISRAWDRRVGFDDATRKRIGDQMARYCRSLWAQDLRGWRMMQLLALARLMKLTREAGFTGSDEHLKQICRLPRGFIDRERAFGVAIARHDRDAKAFDDRLPRIRRDYSALRAAELINGDVHPVDIYYLRDDGSLATAKAIAWMDAASRYIVVHLVFLGPGEGITMAHVAASFAAFVRDEGVMPARLLLDNGAEYNWADFAAQAMRLVADSRMPLGGINDDDSRALIRALPYNASAKAIESRFRLLENNLRDVTGYIGGDRMKSKTHNVGKAPVPYPGSQEDLWREVQTRVTFLNHTPSPVIDGKCPAEIWATRERHMVDYHDLQAAFGVEKTRQLKQGSFRLDGVTYTHDALMARPDLTALVIFIPIFGRRDLIACHHPKTGEFLCHARPDRAYDALDRAGARESARRKKLAKQAIGVMRDGVDTVNVSAEMRAFYELNPTQPLSPPAATIALSGEKGRAAADRRRLSAQPAEPAPVEEPEDFLEAIEKRKKAEGSP